jgi:Protein of unknown function (DUF3237)
LNEFVSSESSGQAGFVDDHQLEEGRLSLVRSAARGEEGAAELLSVDPEELVIIEIQVRPPVDMGGGRRYIAFEGGTFHGRGSFQGTVAPGGIDWQQVRPDGVIEIDAHYVLATHEGETVEVRSTGIRKATEAVTARIAAGEEVAHEQYYFRTHVRLFTSSPGLSWMNDLIAVSTGERRRDGVRIRVYEVL